MRVQVLKSETGKWENIEIVGEEHLFLLNKIKIVYHVDLIKNWSWGILISGEYQKERVQDMFRLERFFSFSKSFNI